MCAQRQRKNILTDFCVYNVAYNVARKWEWYSPRDWPILEEKELKVDLQNY